MDVFFKTYNKILKWVIIVWLGFGMLFTVLLYNLNNDTVQQLLPDTVEHYLYKGFNLKKK